jgi:hypothetical protein
VESILRYIPGFRGYLEREYRRESDELARTYLANELQRCKESLDDHQRQLVDAGRIDLLPQCERLRGRIDTLQSRIRGAVQGYSGFFDFVRVNSELLDDVYEHDLSLASDVAALRKQFESRSSSLDAPSPSAAELLRQIEQLHRRFDRRSEMLEGLASQQKFPRSCCERKGCLHGARSHQFL